MSPDRNDVEPARADSRLDRVGSRKDAVDDATARRRLAEALAREPGNGRALSVSRRHMEPIESDFRWRLGDVVGLHLVDSDLAGSVISGGLLGRVRLEACRFERVRLAPFRGQRVDVRRCEFVRTEFGGTIGTGFERSTILDTSFVACDLRDFAFERCSVAGVAFERPRSHRLAFRRSELTRVTFTGILKPLFFHESTLTDVDFSASDPYDISFLTSTLRRVRMPRSDRCVVVPIRDFAPAVRPVLDRLSPMARSEMARWVSWYGEDSDRPVVVGRDVLQKLPPADVAIVIAALAPSALDVVDWSPPPPP